MAKRSISNTDDIIDSRDVIARIEALTEERDAYAVLPCSESEDGGSGCPTCAQGWADEYPEDAEELRILTALAEEGEEAPDWPYGETLIRDSYFEDYARQLAEDIGALEDNTHWPATCIDWAEAAEQLQQDYLSVDFDGVTYWVRA